MTYKKFDASKTIANSYELKGVFIMENKSIECSVKQCEYNANSVNYCTLGKIKVGTHESNPSVPECTDCMSFKARQKK